MQGGMLQGPCLVKSRHLPTADPRRDASRAVSGQVTSPTHGRSKEACFKGRVWSSHVTYPRPIQGGMLGPAPPA